MVNTAGHQLMVQPVRSRVDEVLSICLAGLRPGQTATIRAATISYPNQPLASSATFVADEKGQVDLGMQKPISGSYDWIDPMGLICSMQPVEKPGQYISVEKARPSLQYDLSPMRVTFTLEIDGKDAASQVIERVWMAEGVERVVVRDEGLHGILFLPPGDGPHPAIILVSGSGGGLNENRAAMFASRGYAALALAYFAYEDLHKDLFEIPLEYFETAIQWLKQAPRIDGDRLVISGASRGGELSLLLGSTFPEFKAVIAYVPSNLVWGGFGTEGNPDIPAWTYRGKPIPYVTHKPGNEEEMEDPDLPIPLTPTFLEAMKDNPSVPAAVIPVEKINGPVLLISGEDDQMWPSALFSRNVMARLEQYCFSHPCFHLCYPGAGHMILAPYLPLNPSHGLHPVDGKDYAYGGNPKDQAFATADSWTHVIEFLQRYLCKPLKVS